MVVIHLFESSQVTNISPSFPFVVRAVRFRTGEFDYGGRMGEQLDLVEASASADGYLFQLRKTLLFCIEQLRSGPDWSVAVEAGDDIEVSHEQGRDFWQLKHRVPGTRITDAMSRKFCHHDGNFRYRHDVRRA
ncbi:hypothetical protein A6A25_39325 [Saccharothrix sp. CB00851]|nr:hypothetical protein A6A25_39325 [Saccharothrix sp. CB00851]